MPESTIRVLRDDCSCTENLVGSWVRKFALKRGASFFFVDEVLFEKENNPCRSSLSQKFSFQASFFKRRQNLLLYHMYHFSKSMMRTKSTRALCFLPRLLPFSVPAILQGRMTSWDWSLRRQHWKLFKWSFRGWRWSRRRCASRILIVE